MKRYLRFTVMLLMVVALSAPVAAQQIDWARQFGTTTFEEAKSVARDATGIYVAGLTDGTLPGQTNAGGMDAFLCRYHDSGTQLWCRQSGIPTNDYAVAVIADDTGVYIAGSKKKATFPENDLGFL
jgi:hypothetical protein